MTEEKETRQYAAALSDRLRTRADFLSTTYGESGAPGPEPASDNADQRARFSQMPLTALLRCAAQTIADLSADCEETREGPCPTHGAFHECAGAFWVRRAPLTTKAAPLGPGEETVWAVAFTLALQGGNRHDLAASLAAITVERLRVADPDLSPQAAGMLEHMRRPAGQEVVPDFADNFMAADLDPPRTFKVGDTVAWADVPDGAMVRYGHGDHAVKHESHGWWVGCGGPWQAFNGSYGWTWDERHPSVTIIALGLTGSESAADLQRMAERFDIRHFLTYGDDAVRHAVEQAAWAGIAFEDGTTHRAIKDALAPRLHSAGWRVGMSAEDAARLLARTSVADLVQEMLKVTCIGCGGQTVCWGTNEGRRRLEPCCDECCMHGDEDGWCTRIGCGPGDLSKLTDLAGQLLAAGWTPVSTREHDLCEWAFEILDLSASAAEDRSTARWYLALRLVECTARAFAAVARRDIDSAHLYQTEVERLAGILREHPSQEQQG